MSFAIENFMIDMDFYTLGKIIKTNITFNRAFNNITKKVNQHFNSFCIAHAVKSKDEFYRKNEDSSDKYFYIYRFDKKHFKKTKELRAYIKVPYGCNYKQLISKKYDLEDYMGYKCDIYKTDYNDVLCMVVKTNLGKLLYKFDKKFSSLMTSLNIKNELSQTFEVNSVSLDKANSIYDLEVKIPHGLTASVLEHKKKELETAFKCIACINYNRFSDSMNIKLITKDLNKFYFEPIKTKAEELYVGKTMYNTNCILDINKAGHVLICGMTGTGKNILLSSILTNLFYNSSSDVDTYCFQIMKGELSLFEDCKPVVGFYDKLQDIEQHLADLADLTDKRSKSFAKLGLKNLKHYNSHFPDKKLNRKLIVIDEFSFFVEDKSDSEEVRILKNKCWSHIAIIIKAGRSSGVNIIAALQRPTADNLNTTVRSQMTRITLRLSGEIDSKIAIDSDAATSLGFRECLVYGPTIDKELASPNIIVVPIVDEDNEILKNFVPEIKSAAMCNLPKEVLKERELVINNMMEQEEFLHNKSNDLGIIEEPLEEEDMFINQLLQEEKLINNSKNEVLVIDDKSETLMGKVSYIEDKYSDIPLSKTKAEKIPPTNSKKKTYRVPLNDSEKR